MKFSQREIAMLLVALDNLVLDYAKARRRAKRQCLSATYDACSDAITRYTHLALRISRSSIPRALGPTISREAASKTGRRSRRGAPSVDRAHA